MLELKNLKIFKEIGTRFQKKTESREDIFFNKKKEEEFKKNLIIKSLLCICLTNLLTYLTLSPNQDENINTTSKIEGMVTMSIPLDSYLPISNSLDHIKLVGPNNETITNEAIIESMTEKEVLLEDKEVPIYIVQLKKEDAQKLVNYQNKMIRAYPAIIKDAKKIATGEPYEIKF